MTTLCSKSWKDYKSSWRALVWIWRRRREDKKRDYKVLEQRWKEALEQRTQCETVIQQQQQTIRQLKEQVRRLEAEWQRATCQLPPDPPIATHGYGARMVCVAANLAKVIGFRATERVLNILFAWLEIEQKIPDWTTIRIWLQRLGVAAVAEPVEQADDWIWMVDHSNQIGPEKALVVLGVQACNLPPPGTTLKHEDVHVLRVQPDTDWKREDMETVYNELAEQYGAPRSLLMDGAAELREGAKTLQKQRPDTIVLHDFKHKAANLFKAILGNDERFAEFMSLVGRTRSAIQQTELAHLSPPSIKQKARFMNMKARLRWAATMLWLLEHPQAQSRQWMTAERLEQKLGWLRAFADNLAVWCECEEVIEKGVKFINEQGLFHGAASQLRNVLGSVSHTTSQRLAEKLIDFVAAAEAKLKQGERLPMSTEILESSFALYKQLERQHSKGGFTSLLASFGALLQDHTPATVREALLRVSVKDVNDWVAENLGNTLTSKRRATYNEFKSSTESATTVALTI